MGLDPLPKDCWFSLSKRSFVCKLGTPNYFHLGVDDFQDQDALINSLQRIRGMAVWYMANGEVPSEHQPRRKRKR